MEKVSKRFINHPHATAISNGLGVGIYGNGQMQKLKEDENCFRLVLSARLEQLVVKKTI